MGRLCTHHRLCVCELGMMLKQLPEQQFTVQWMTPDQEYRKAAPLAPLTLTSTSSSHKNLSWTAGIPV